MAYSVVSGEISPGCLYLIAGSQSIIYNSVTYSTGQIFKGVIGVTTFVYSGSGTQAVNEVHQLTAGSIEFAETFIDIPGYPETTLLLGMTVEFALTEAEKIVNEVTNIRGFAIELIDYPFYSFEITETRL